MSGYRKMLSGSQYAKIRKEKEEKCQNEIDKTKKYEFFKPICGADHCCSSFDNSITEVITESNDETAKFETAKNEMVPQVIENITAIDYESTIQPIWYDRWQRRPDLIHLNRAGLLKIKTHLLKNNVLSEEES